MCVKRNVHSQSTNAHLRPHTHSHEPPPFDYKKKLFTHVLISLLNKLTFMLIVIILLSIVCALWLTVVSSAIVSIVTDKDKPTEHNEPIEPNEPVEPDGDKLYGCAKDAANEDAPYSCQLMTSKEGGQWKSKEECRCWKCAGPSCVAVTDPHQKGLFNTCSTCAYSCTS